MAAPLLGHSTFATTERFYNQAQAHQAAQHWQAHILALWHLPTQPAQDGEGG